MNDETFSVLEARVHTTLKNMCNMWEALSDTYINKKIDMYEKNGQIKTYIIHELVLTEDCNVCIVVSLVDDVFNSEYVDFFDAKDRCKRIYL